MKKIPLNKLKDGECGIVTDPAKSAVPAVQQRLEDLGIIPGTRIRCLYRSPLRDPAAYEIRGAVIALRQEDSCGILVEPVEEDPQQITIALAGNPNVGKSTVFNTLTGLHQHTGNWAGKTVERAEGLWHIHWEEKDKGEEQVVRLVDIPGCYSLESASPEEEVSRDFLKSGECSGVIVVCDGTCLHRNLILVLQILKLAAETETLKVALCINMMDQVKKQGIQIDKELLSQLLGIPVCMTQSRKPAEMRRQLEEMTGNFWLGPETERTEAVWQRTSKALNLKDADSAGLVCLAETIAGQVVRDSGSRKDVTKMDRILTRPLTGFPIMGLLLLAVFWITLRGANYPSQLLSSLLFSLEEPFYCFLHEGLGLPSGFAGMMVYGMYRVLAWVVSVMLPPMAIFFPLFTLLEDWGFLPRVAFNLDRCFHCCRACGKQALTLCMGFGCNASGVVGCRIIDSRRERLLAMITNSLVPCNGRFPVLIAVITMFFGYRSAPLILTAVILISIGATFLMTRILSSTLLRGMPSSFTLELPPFRRPQFGKVIVRSLLDRTLFVLARAAAVAAPAGLLIYVLAGAGVLEPAAEFLDPLGRLIGLDGVILLSFLLGLPANEIVLPVMMMIYMGQGTLNEVTDLLFFRQLLAENGWTALTAVNMLIFTLMHWPCATTILTIRKESGSWKWALAAVLAPFLMGCIFCGAVKMAACIFLA